jgi:hypothetical protein
MMEVTHDVLREMEQPAHTRCRDADAVQQRIALEEQQQAEKVRQREAKARLHGPCPECGSELTPITLFGRGPENPLSGAAVDAALLYYVEQGAGRSMMLGMFTEIGHVLAAICPSCRRIAFRGQPKDLRTEPPPCSTGQESWG